MKKVSIFALLFLIVGCDSAEDAIRGDRCEAIPGDLYCPDQSGLELCTNGSETEVWYTWNGMEFPCGGDVESCTLEVLTNLINACNNPDTATATATTYFSVIGNLPERISASLAVDVTQLQAFAKINRQRFAMNLIRGSTDFRKLIRVTANSQVTFDLLFQEILPDGQILILAEFESLTFTMGSNDRVHVVSEELYSYDFDDDRDGISNIAERTRGTNPFIPN